MTSSVIITDTYGSPLGNRREELEQLKQMGCTLDNDKVDLRGIDIKKLIIKKNETNTIIIAHTNGKKKGDTRPESYYFFYRTDDASIKLIKTLEDFLEKADEERKRRDIKIIDNYGSLYLCRDIKSAINAINNKEPSINDKQINSIKNAIFYLINLDHKIGGENISYNLVGPNVRTSEKSDVVQIEIFINPESNDDEAIKTPEFKESKHIDYKTYNKLIEFINKYMLLGIFIIIASALIYTLYYYLATEQNSGSKIFISLLMTIIIFLCFYIFFDIAREKIFKR